MARISLVASLLALSIAGSSEAAYRLTFSVGSDSAEFYSSGNLLISGSSASPVLSLDGYTMTKAMNQLFESPPAFNAISTIPLFTFSKAGSSPLTITSELVSDSPILDLLAGASTGVQVSGANLAALNALPLIQYVLPGDSVFVQTGPIINSGVGGLTSGLLTDSLIVNGASAVVSSYSVANGTNYQTATLSGMPTYTVKETLVLSGVNSNVTSFFIEGSGFILPNAVPEPSSIVLCSIGILSWIGYSRRKRTA